MSRVFAVIRRRQQRLDLLAIIGGAMQALGQNIAILRNAGAENFFVANAPNLGKTPVIIALGAGTPAEQLSNGFNIALDAILEKFAANGLQVYRLDLFSFVDVATDMPHGFGFADASTPCVQVFVAPASQICSDPDQHLFWDGIRPTRAGHRLVGTIAVNQLSLKQVPGWARGEGSLRAQTDFPVYWPASCWSGTTIVLACRDGHRHDRHVRIPSRTEMADSAQLIYNLGLIICAREFVSMPNRVVRVYAVVCAVMLTWSFQAGAPATSAPSPSLTEAQQDLQSLYESLKSAHFDLYTQRSKAQYDALYEQMIARLAESTDELEIHKSLMQFVAYGNIGHAYIDFPVAQYVSFLESAGKLLPLDVEFVGDTPVVEHVYAAESAHLVGQKLVSINDMPVATVIVRMRPYVSAERDYMLYARLEHMLPRLWWLEFGDTASVEITVRDTAGKLTAIELSGAPVMDIERRKGSLEVRFHSREFAVRDDHIAYLRPGAFGPQNEDDSLQKLENWLANAFAEIEEQDVTDLIVDLRNNPGGDSSFSDPLIAHFADEPFHFASRFDVRASAEVAAVLQELAATEPEGVSAQMLKLLQTTPLGETFEFRIPEVPPAQPRFTGKVWAFVNRHSYSNATVAAAIIQDYGFGLVTGEETADLPTSLASSAKFTLPHSGIAVTFPKARFVRPSGNEDLRGVIPDIPLSADQLKADTVPDMLVKHIQQQGSRQ